MRLTDRAGKPYLRYGFETPFPFVCAVIYLLARPLQYRVRYRGRTRLKFTKVSHHGSIPIAAENPGGRTAAAVSAASGQVERPAYWRSSVGVYAEPQYFTGLVWRSSERFLGALVTPSELIYIVPGFERSRVESLPHLSGEIRGWEEEENSAALIASLLPAGASLAVDDAIPLFAYNLLRQEIAPERLLDGGPLIREQRICKSENEIAIIQYAMNLTLEVHRRAHAMIKPGVAASEVVRFIGEQHRALGARGGSTFCIVSFGAATALPHGADGEQFYQPGDVVLVDTGCRIDGYHSDLTRTYMLDEPSKEFAQIWAIEREAQQAVFDAARLGVPCSALDDAARASLSGMGSDRITSCRACHTGPDMGWALKSTKLPISCAQTRCL